MKNRLTENIGLKLISLVAAFFLWLVVVNVDDPVINKTYTNIPVEILNGDIISDEGKCYEVMGGSDQITVVVTAKRSVIDDMSRDYIKATADMRALTFLDTVPIEVKTTRFADKIESVSTRTESLKLHLENVVEHTVPLNVSIEGKPEEGHILESAIPKFDKITVLGPESSVLNVASASCVVDVTNLSADESLYVPVELLSADGTTVTDNRLAKDNANVSVNVVIWATKEIPLSAGISGSPAEGYSVVGTPYIEPETVVITGRSAYLDSMTAIQIPSDAVSVGSASGNVTTEVDITKLLPAGISFADEGYDGKAQVTVVVAANDKKTVTIPLQNITVGNVPEGYKANIVDVGESINVEIQGKGDAFDQYDGSTAVGLIDALMLIPRDTAESAAAFPTGDCDGRVTFNLPAGITETSPIFLEVIVEKNP